MIKLLLLALIAAVPGCVPEEPVIARVEVLNRTDTAITINAEGSLDDTVVEACSSRTFDSMRLNHVNIEQAGTNGAIINAPGGGAPRYVILITAVGAEIRTDTPEPLPECHGSLP